MGTDGRLAMTMLNVSLKELPRGSIMRQNAPWVALGMSRASWYRQGKPATKPPKPETRAEFARRLNVSQRTLYRAIKADKDERAARWRKHQDGWLREALKKHQGKSDQQISDLWKAHVASLTDEQVNKIMARSVQP